MKYEPYSVLTVPLPPEPLRLAVNVLPAMYTGGEDTVQTRRTVVFSGNRNDLVGTMYSTLAKKLNVPEESMLICILNRNEVGE